MKYLGLVLGLLLVGCQPAEETEAPELAPRAVKVTTVQEASAGVEYNYPATVLSAQKAELSFRVGGQVVELPIHAMSEVKKGDLIAKIDPRDYASTVKQLQAQLAAERSRLKAMTSGSRSEDIASLRASVAASEARVVSARSDAERALTQYRKGLIPKEQIDSALAAVKTAQAQLAAQQQDLNKGRTGSRQEDVATQNAVIQSIQTQLNNAQDVADDAALLAPFDGIVAERLVDNFANVQPKQTIAVIQDLQNLELSVNLPGPDVARFGAHREALTLEATLDAVPNRRFAAELVEFTSQADARTRTFEARVSIERPADYSILPGMVGQLIVTDRSKAEGEVNTRVPNGAISADSDGAPVVWIVGADNKVEMRKVTLGDVTADGIAVLEGLNVGDVVVSAGVSAMIPGLEVRPITEVGK
ncbi:efflux RND transporter periplasmic adaptor subunit [Leucothrix sargassi]|nr:efflux RND transporter periplasmic adaptor subunit [Leucothrix sargassi]